MRENRLFLKQVGMLAKPYKLDRSNKQVDSLFQKIDWDFFPCHCKYCNLAGLFQMPLNNAQDQQVAAKMDHHRNENATRIETALRT